MDIVTALKNGYKSIVINGEFELVNWVAADEIERLRKALQFYADPENYEYKLGNFNVMSNVEYNEIGLDDGAIARAALKGDGNGRYC